MLAKEKALCKATQKANSSTAKNRKSQAKAANNQGSGLKEKQRATHSNDSDICRAKTEQNTVEDIKYKRVFQLVLA